MLRTIRPVFMWLAAAAAALALGACSGSSSSTHTSTTPPACRALAESCGGGAGTCCAPNTCVAGTCATVTATCADGVQNGSETGVDCGGAECLALFPAKTCADGIGCGSSSDCTSGFCNTTTHLCATPTCSDGLKNGAETGWTAAARRA